VLEKLAYFKAPRCLFFTEALREEPLDWKKGRGRVQIAYWTLIH
jgi:hypothetical protein